MKTPQEAANFKEYADTVTLAKANLSQELTNVATRLLDLGHIVAYFPDRHRRAHGEQCRTDHE